MAKLDSCNESTIYNAIIYVIFRLSAISLHGVSNAYVNASILLQPKKMRIKKKPNNEAAHTIPVYFSLSIKSKW